MDLPTAPRLPRGHAAASRHGLLYTFEGPVRPVECAVAVAQLRGSLRFGVHAGEIELRPGEAGGAVPAIAATVLEAAHPGEVVVTGVVKDLTLGADLQFTFPGGPGRTTRPEDFNSLFGGLQSKIFDRLPDETWIYPGHGNDTTLGAERPHLAEWRERGW